MVLPATQKLAVDMGLGVVDMFAAFAGRAEAFTDADHLQVGRCAAPWAPLC